MINFHDLPQISEGLFQPIRLLWEFPRFRQFSNLTGNESAIPIPRPVKVFPTLWMPDPSFGLKLSLRRPRGWIYKSALLASEPSREGAKFSKGPLASESCSSSDTISQIGTQEPAKWIPLSQQIVQAGKRPEGAEERLSPGNSSSTHHHFRRSPWQNEWGTWGAF